VLLVMAGIVVVVLFSLAGRVAILHRLPLLRVVVTGNWIMNATIIAIVGAILGALYPAYNAAQKDPIEALAYEYTHRVGGRLVSGSCGDISSEATLSCKLHSCSGPP